MAPCKWSFAKYYHVTKQLSRKLNGYWVNQMVIQDLSLILLHWLFAGEEAKRVCLCFSMIKWAMSGNEVRRVNRATDRSKCDVIIAWSRSNCGLEIKKQADREPKTTVELNVPFRFIVLQILNKPCWRWAARISRQIFRCCKTLRGLLGGWNSKRKERAQIFLLFIQI